MQLCARCAAKHAAIVQLAQSGDQDNNCELCREEDDDADTVYRLVATLPVAPQPACLWKQAVITSLPDRFDRRDSVTMLKAAHEQQRAERYAEIGRLKTHVNFLKKSYRLHYHRAT
ncbi:MAG: hypothetical protein HGA19_18035 [Oscillochloris sp.]|nr:hypothetical protein [Oscillochloris sp.]